MALLSLLRMSYRGRIAAAHLEHGFRGEASMADAAFVENHCRELGVDCYVKHVDVASCRLKGESPETAGRRIRYEFFDEISDKENLPFIATAHNAGDVVETVTHHFFRGTGIAGLSGIAERRGAVVRPLINCSREDLRRFLRAGGIQWREDETNVENCYTRNKIRNELLPLVRSNLNGSVDRSIVGLAGECSLASSGARDEADVLLRLVARDHPFALAAWDSRAARRLSDAQLPATLRAQADMLGLPVADRKRIEEACRLIRGRGRRRFQWAGDVELCCGNALSGWMERRLLEPPGTTCVKLGDGDGFDVEWGPWTIGLRMKRPDSPGQLKRGISRIELPSHDASGTVEISDANSFMKKNNSGFHVKIPWWSSYNTPVISWKSENSFESQIPGFRGNVRGEGVYVIIAQVFARKRRRAKEEKF
jgi:tRNA(Ile)-lysidine synthase